MADAIELGLTPSKVREKMVSLRTRKAKKFGISIPEMEAVCGFDLDDMAASLIVAIKHDRCRGPRCGRIRFRDLVKDDEDLRKMTCDVIDPDPENPPLWCLTIRWVCGPDNSGDNDDSLQDRVRRLVAQRKAQMQLAISVSLEEKREQLRLFEPTS